MHGFTFNGVHSDAFNIIVNRKDIPLTPPVKNRLQEIAGHDGAYDYGVTYQPKPIEIECTIFGNTRQEMKDNARKLAALLDPRNGAKPLIFDDEPDKMYFARLANKLPLDPIGAFGTFTIMFTCPDPFTYGTELRSGSFTGTMNVEHRGLYVSLPVLTVTHGGGNGQIKNTRPDGIVETLTFKDDSPSGTYIIDCKEGTITKDGEAAYDFVDGDFISLISGKNVLTNSGNVTRTAIEFRDTWL